jgi:hypothetical protein
MILRAPPLLPDPAGVLVFLRPDERFRALSKKV